MKLFVLTAVLYSIFVVAFGTPVEQQPARLKEEEAIKYCNSTFPVTEDSREKVAKIVINGETIPDPTTFNNNEWCNLNCVLEKVGFFDAEGKMQVHRIYKYVLKFSPDIGSNSSALLIHLQQISRSMKDLEDRCMKAFVAYYRFTEAVMIATLVADLNANPELKEKVMEAVQSSDVLPKEMEVAVDKSFKNVNLFFKKTVESDAYITSTVAPVPPA